MSNDEVTITCRVRRHADGTTHTPWADPETGALGFMVEHPSRPTEYFLLEINDGSCGYGGTGPVEHYSEVELSRVPEQQLMDHLDCEGEGHGVVAFRTDTGEVSFGPESRLLAAGQSDGQ